jgi:hypothetical protein
MEDSRIYGLKNPLNGWKIGDKIWIDDDAETTAVQGQPYSPQPSGTWKVYTKQRPWEYQQQLLKSSGSYSTDDGYGSSVKMSADGLIVVAGSPQSGVTGTVNTFFKNYDGEFLENFSINPLGANTRTFGSTVDLATTSVGVTTLGIGAPTSFIGNANVALTQDNVGHVYIYNKTLNSTTFERGQILVGNIGDLFGTSMAFNQNGEWLYIGAPGNNRMYAYGLNRFIPQQQQIKSVNDKNTLFFSGNIVANVGDIITQPTTGARTRVNENYLTTGSNLYLIVDNLTNFDYSANVIVGNILVTSGAYVNDTARYATNKANVSITNRIPLNFVPTVPTDANSLLITNGGKTYIPTVDYTIVSNVNAPGGYDVSFISGNIEQSDYAITQQPYYQRIDTLTMSSTGISNASADYGFALSSSFGGEQVAVGAPKDTVNVGVFATTTTSGIQVSIPVGVATANILYQGNVATLTSYHEYTGAGSVYVWDRVIEAFNTITDAVPGTAGQDYQTVNPIASVHKVTLDNVEVTDYIVVGSNTIRFITPPPIGRVMFVEVNKFNLLERLIGVDSLEGGLAAIQKDAYFGTSLTICSNNCAIYIGAPNYDNGTEYNSGAVWKFHNRGRLYGTNTGYAVDPIFTPGDTIRLNDFEVTLTGTTLGNLVADINNAGILGVTATNEAGKLRLDSDVTVAKDQLRIVSGVRQPGSNGVLADSDLIVFAFMQIIINPYGNPGEYFGNKVKLASNAYMLIIGSRRGTTKEFTTFDITTIASGTQFDATTTRWYENIIGSGSVYVYELYDDPRNQVEHPGRYAFAQQLDPGSLVGGSQFGTSLDIEGTFITVSAPGATVANAAPNSGTIYIFENLTMARGW